MALTQTGLTTSYTSRSGAYSEVRRYDSNLTEIGATITHRHLTTGATFVFEYGGPSASTQSSVATGASPRNLENFLYGKIIPLSVLGGGSSNFGGGLARIGTAGLIYGPYFSGGTASFAVSFGFPANPSGERRVYEIALDGKIAWENAAGSPAGALGAGFITDPFECRFYSGTQTQGADPLEVSMFGDQAVAYRPQMMLWFSGLPITQFDNKVPFVSCKIGDVTGGAVAGAGINLGEALEAVAYSPWIAYDSGSFETSGVADIVQAMILTEDQSFLDLLGGTARIYRTLDILQTDKLRVNDRGSVVTPDVILHRDNVSADAGVQYVRQEESSVPRELELVTIDPDADYVFMPSKAMRPLTPVPVTSSVGKETITLPVVIGATTRASLVTYAKYQEDHARKRVSLQTMLYGYALEPGDLFRLTDIANGFDNGEVWKVVETSHGANYINEIIGEAILKCAFEDAPTGDVILLLHANVSPIVDHSPYAWTMTTRGTPTIDTSIKKFGDASFLFDGAADAIDTPTHNNPAWDISPTNTSPYTIELWAQFDSVLIARNQILICRFSGFISKAWVLFLPASSSELRFQTYSDGANVSAITSTSGAVFAEGWHHIAVDKSSTGKVRIYVDGVMKGSNTPADSVIFNAIVSTTIGGSGLAGSDYNFLGNIDDVRITKGMSRYGDLFGNATFSPPGSQFPDPV